MAPMGADWIVRITTDLNMDVINFIIVLKLLSMNFIN